MSLLPVLVCFWRNSPQWARASSCTRFLNHTQRRTTVGRTPLDEWSARRRDLYLTTHNTHNRQTSMPLMGFKPAISAGERPQTYASDRAVTGTGLLSIYARHVRTTQSNASHNASCRDVIFICLLPRHGLCAPAYFANTNHLTFLWGTNGWKCKEVPMMFRSRGVTWLGGGHSIGKPTHAHF